MAKYRDYFNKRYNTKELEIVNLSFANISYPFIDAKSDGIKILKVSKEEWRYLAGYFEKNLPWNWDGKKIWGITLKVI